jgi:hypothetical protein
VLADDEQERRCITAERAGEGAAVQVQRREDLAALADPYAALVADIGEPHGTFRIDTDPVRMVAGRVRPHPPVAEGASRPMS